MLLFKNVVMPKFIFHLILAAVHLVPVQAAHAYDPGNIPIEKMFLQAMLFFASLLSAIATVPIIAAKKDNEGFRLWQLLLLLLLLPSLILSGIFFFIGMTILTEHTEWPEYYGVASLMAFLFLIYKSISSVVYYVQSRGT